MNNIYLELNKNNIVVNAIEYDGTSFYDSNYVLIPWDPTIRPWIGWTYNIDGSWTPPFNESGE